METDPVPIVQVVWWAPETVSNGTENLVPTPGFKPQTIQPIASIYTHVKKVYRGSRLQHLTTTSNRWTSVVNFTPR